MGDGAPPSLPLRSARLPRADAILPYLAEIDRNRWYSNFGALAQRLATRLADHFGVAPAEILCVASGTAGLTAALAVDASQSGALCAMPSFTFAATPSAAIAAGLAPYFLDVDPATWTLTPETVAAALAKAPGKIAYAMPVSPFGLPLDAAAWDAFSARTGVKVVLDAAWAFDSLRPGQAPAIVSLHATKVLGIGEGGVVVARDPAFVARLRRHANFGLDDNRTVAHAGANYKISEYSAAVGLAALDAWPETRARVLALAASYRAALAGLEGIRLLSGFEGSAGAVCAVELVRPNGPAVVERLSRRGIEARLWWGKPCHTHPAFHAYGRGPLAHTEWLAPRVLCLPFFPDLTSADVARVRDALASSLGD
jgi:dTDP-4-amino-4,6-dideoxygalactose transaminase